MSMSTTLKEPAAPARPASGRLRQAWRAALPSLALVLLIVALWEAAVRLLQVSAFVVPAPSAIVAVLFERQDELFQASLVTGAEILYGFLCSCVVGIALALLVDRYAWFGPRQLSAHRAVPERAEDRAGAAADPVVWL
ncbi:hypothetical protein WJ968_08715 [Achromobacter xylosoxidans]